MDIRVFSHRWSRKTGLSLAAMGLVLFGAIAPVVARDGILRADDPKSRINLRQSADATSQILGYGIVGDKVQILEQLSGKDGYVWYRVKFVNSGAVGWVRGTFLKETTVTTKEGVLRADDPKAQINLRQSASATSQLVGYGMVGDKVEILEQAAGKDGFVWYKVKFPKSGSIGWIRGTFVKVP